MFKIVQLTETEYDPSADKEELEAIVRDLNRDAEEDESLLRWMVVQAK